MLQLREMDDRVPLADQLSEEVGPVILINTFRVAPEDADTLLEAWAADAAYLKQQPGFISAQLHRGIAGSGMFLNHAVWESVQAFRNAFGDPQFQATASSSAASASGPTGGGCPSGRDRRRGVPARRLGLDRRACRAGAVRLGEVNPDVEAAPAHRR
jgi:heme-degrading monooxygenase HmoA